MGQRLSSAVDAYNTAVGSLERQVMPRRGASTELGVTADAPSPALEPIGQLVRSTGAPSAAETAGSAAPVDPEVPGAAATPAMRRKG